MFFFKDGILLFSQIFHDESVIQLKCHTQFPSQIRSLIEQVFLISNLIIIVEFMIINLA